MHIHFVGCNGVSMRALCELTRSYGHTVTGSDAATTGHDEKNVIGADLVVYTNAVRPDNCELAYAREHGIPTVERAAYLGELSRRYGSVIAVAGCHGKSTTTAMLGGILTGATVHVGVAGCSRVGDGGMFVTEACEYKGSFLSLAPDIGVILNIGFDHPDYYRSDRELREAYAAFLARCKRSIVNGDDTACLALGGHTATFGFGKNCDYRAEKITASDGRRAFMFCTGNRTAKVTLSVTGIHNVYNALAALAAADMAGADLTAARRAVESFTGLPRRFERRGTAYGKTVICDYAHHPDEIVATVNAARELYPSVAVVFQPHTYSRTEAMREGFVNALSLADTVVLLPIFAAREAPTDITSQALCRQLTARGACAYCFDDREELLGFCRVLEERAIIFMGAGDVDKLCDEFLL